MRGGRYLVVLAGVSVLAGVGVLAAGCGTTQAVSLTAAVTSTAGQTARISVTMTSQTQGMSVSFTETGVFDFAHSRGMLSMQSPLGMTEIFIPPKAYIKIAGAADGPLPHGKSWIAMDAGNSGPLVSSLLAPFGGGTDPADLLASLTAISSSVTNLGPATIRGVHVTGYRVDIDPAKAASRVPSWERAGFLGFASSLGSGAIPVDVWVDSQNLVRQVKVSLHAPGGSGPPAPGAPADSGPPVSVTLVQVTDFYDFGVPVRVSAPPASEITSMPVVKSVPAAAAGSGGSTSPPPVSGTLTAAQAAAAEGTVTAFWSALGRNVPAAVARTVLPAERSCIRGFLSSSGGPKITVTSLRGLSAQPAGNRAATVRFTVKAQATLGGQSVPVFPQGPGGVQWLVTTERAGHWYVNLTRSGALTFSGVCG
jgi:hypothetical protein